MVKGMEQGEWMELNVDRNRAEDGRVLDMESSRRAEKAEVFTRTFLHPYFDIYPHNPISHNTSHPTSY